MVKYISEFIVDSRALHLFFLSWVETKGR